jgi:hypothetical protein
MILSLYEQSNDKGRLHTDDAALPTWVATPTIIAEFRLTADRNLSNIVPLCRALLNTSSCRFCSCIMDVTSQLICCIISRSRAGSSFDSFLCCSRASFHKAPMSDDSSSSFMMRMYLESMHKEKFNGEQLSNIERGKEHRWL